MWFQWQNLLLVAVWKWNNNLFRVFWHHDISWCPHLWTFPWIDIMECFQTICSQIPVKAFSDPPPSSSIVLWVSSPRSKLYFFLFCITLWIVFHCNIICIRAVCIFSPSESPSSCGFTFLMSSWQSKYRWWWWWWIWQWWWTSRGHRGTQQRSACSCYAPSGREPTSRPGSSAPHSSGPVGKMVIAML